MDAVDTILQEAGDRMLAQIRAERAAKALKTAQITRAWGLARNYRREWASTPCVCRACAMQTACGSAWQAPECSL